MSLWQRCRFEDGLKLVKIRGESMQAAADARPSGMVSVIGLDADKARFDYDAHTLRVETASHTDMAVNRLLKAAQALSRDLLCYPSKSLHGMRKGP